MNQENRTIILDYDPDFIVYQEKSTRKFFASRPDEEDEEVELCAELTYDVFHDIEASDDVLVDLFDSDYCGEQVLDDCIKYLWFKRKK